ncbi:expressed unknown protein [Seminavis robusta]|uniref:Uncharacterized protein n=1 Tax=Seminavis robusta TaxID=568900 RepID=A0A9N8E0I6_9STRA|nr:expressed unknown protein [Seminavis robusta]|eukprot:Sro389_g132560.1 n/a (235) ;mRNA; r:24829-25533
MSSSSHTPQKTPWVKVTVSSSEENLEMERLIDTGTPTRTDQVVLEEEPTAQATIVCEKENKEQNDVKTEGPHVVERHEDYPKAIVAASATAGGVLGCLVGGIGCAVVGAFGSAFAAKHKAGSCVGDCARAMGEVAIAVQEKAVALDEKHHIVTATKKAAGESWDQAQAIDNQYRVAEKGKNCILATGKAAMDFTVRHRLVERSAEAAGRGLTYVGSKIVVTAEDETNKSVSTQK